MKRHLTTYSKQAAYSIAIAVFAFMFTGQNSFAQSPPRPNLGAASTYAVFTGAGAIGVAIGDTAVLAGDIGWNTGGPLTGFPPSTYTGTYNHGNTATALALSDLNTAWNANCLTCGTVTNTTITNLTFTPGTYATGAASTTNGNITFNAQGDENAIFIVNIGGALSAASGTHILLENNARAANIYWFVKGQVTIADSSSFAGTIIAGPGEISFAGKSSLDGRALSTAGAINLAANHMSLPTDSGTANNLTVVRPDSGELIRGGILNDTIKWTGSGIARVKTLQYSLDSGVTWTTITTITTDSLDYVWHVPDTTSTKALVRVTDTSNLRGVSGLFTITSSKIIVVHPALAEMIAGGTQNYQITWTGIGLTPKKTFALSLDSGATWTTIGTISSNVFAYGWNVPDTISTKAIIRITDSNNIAGKSGVFTIKSGKIIVVRPALAEIISAGTQSYQITWTGTGLAPKKTFALSLDSGLTWTTIGSVSTNLFAYSWNVPDTASTKAVIRITDSTGVTGKSGLFTIKSSKITVVRPALAETIIEGTQSYQIAWTGIGLAPQKTIALSLDSGLTWATIGTVSGNIFTYSWNVLDTVSSKAVVRITDGSGITGKSGVFNIISNKAPAIVIVTPQPGEVITGGTQNYQITWTGTAIAPMKTLFYSLDNGVTWTTIGILNSSALAYSWNVPDTSSSKAIVRIADGNGVTGESGVFTISKKAIPGSIVVINPAKEEVIAGGTQNYQIVFTAVNVTPQKTLEYSLDGGASWSAIGTMNSESLTYSWATVPNVATTQALVRITDGNGVTGTSGLFTITLTQGVGSINSLTLSGLDGNRNIGNNQNLGISWAYTPDIGTSVSVEYSLDGMLTWSPIATVPTTESPNSTTWVTTATDYHNPVFIRVTSTEGMTATSIAFSIGSNASVSPFASDNEYSVSNYPNPTRGQTTISFDLSIRSDVTLIVSDNLGRQINLTTQSFEPGMHTIPFDATQLSDGVYIYTLVAGTTRMNGRMSVVR